MDVEVELSRILINEYSGEQYIFLREKAGQRVFPIVIGIAEALAIDRRLKGEQTLRPMTHDLMASIIEAMGGAVERIVINDLRQLSEQDMGQTFIATIHIRQGGRMLQIDSRPSDAIALGVAMSTPIYVAPHVIDAVLKEPPTLEAKLDLLRRRMAMLGERITDIQQQLEDEQFTSETPAEVVDEARRELKERQAEYDAIERILKKIL